MSNIPHEMNEASNTDINTDRDTAIAVLATRKTVIFPVPRLPIPLSISNQVTIQTLKKAHRTKRFIFITTYNDLDDDTDEFCN